MQENSINNDNFNNKASFLLSLAWALMPIVIMIEQSLKLDQILGNLFLMYITVLGMFTFFFFFLYNYKKYKTKLWKRISVESRFLIFFSKKRKEKR